MGTVPMGTGELRRIHSLVVWMSGPVERSMTVSAPQRVAQVSLATSSSMEEVTAELPMLALTFTRNRRPMTIGSDSGWFTLAGRMARPCGQLLSHDLGLDALPGGGEGHLLGDAALPGVVQLGDRIHRTARRGRGTRPGKDAGPPSARRTAARPSSRRLTGRPS